MQIAARECAEFLADYLAAEYAVGGLLSRRVLASKITGHVLGSLLDC